MAGRMNKYNSLMSDAHCDLNDIVCGLCIHNEPLGSDFDYEYYKACKFLVEHALEEVDMVVSLRMKEQEASEAEPQGAEEEAFEAEPQSEGNRSDKNEVK